MMKTAIIGPVYPYRGGIAHYTTMLARAIEAEGQEVRVFSFRRQYPAWLYPGTSDKDPSAQPLRVEADYILDPLKPWTWIQAVNSIARYCPDLVAFQWWTTFWAVPYAVVSRSLRSRNFRLVSVIHNVMPHEQRPWDATLARLALSQSHSFIAQTAHEKERLQKLLPQAEIQLCPLPVYPMLSGEKLDKITARSHLGLPESGAILLFFGIIRPYKGLQILLEALGKLAARGVRPRLLIAGEFWEDQEKYRAQIERYGLTDQVRIEDRYIPNEEVGLFFSAADALVAPYTGGTQSAAAGVGLGYGLPLIVSDIVAAGIDPAYLKRVLTVPAGDADALANVLQEFLSHPGIFPATPAPVGDAWGSLVRTLGTAALGHGYDRITG